MRNLVLLGLVLAFGSANVWAGVPKVYVCHKGKTIHIARNAVAAHVAHGDDSGRCEALPKSVAMIRCGTVEGAIVVNSASFSGYVPQALVVNPGIGCSEAISFALQHGYVIRNVNAGNEQGFFETETLLTGPGKRYRHDGVR